MPPLVNVLIDAALESLAAGEIRGRGPTDLYAAGLHRVRGIGKNSCQGGKQSYRAG